MTSPPPTTSLIASSRRAGAVFFNRGSWRHIEDQQQIGTNKTFDSEKPTLIALAKAFVAKLR